jgi:uncharacterized protein YndB with AHSA1/START domain
MPTRVDTASKIIQASARSLYEAFATAGALESWLPPEGMRGEMLAFDFRDGGGYRMRLVYNDPNTAAGKSTPDADELEVRFTRLIPNREIGQAVTFDSDDPAFAGEMHITWTFEPNADGTLVTIRCGNVPLGIRAEDHEVGMTSTLNNLAAYLHAR